MSQRVKIMLSDGMNAQPMKAEITIRALPVDQTGAIEQAIAAIGGMFSVEVKERLERGILEIPGPR